MKETATTSTPEVDLNPHSDLPVAGIISTEISTTTGERPDVSPPMSAPADVPADVPVRPFGVFTGTERLAMRLARAAAAKNS